MNTHRAIAELVISILFAAVGFAGAAGDGVRPVVELGSFLAPPIIDLDGNLLMSPYDRLAPIPEHLAAALKAFSCTCYYTPDLYDCLQSGDCLLDGFTTLCRFVYAPTACANYPSSSCSCPIDWTCSRPGGCPL